ncbi:MAG TPA: DNA polymerase III subunit delta [Stellaceae bacterium]|nr:DNA polymerase III subunit delta [Stellaceae bacterium]
MKIAANRLAEFLRQPPSELRAALFYGPDGGQVRERADRLATAICPDLADPFRISELTAAGLAADPARLADEVAAMSLVGGRRVVRLRDATDGVTTLLAAALTTVRGDSLIVVEAGDLPARSSLRKLCEATASAAAIACYADSARDIADLIRETMSARRIAIAGDAQAYLVAHLGGDRMVTRQELEKLTLYAGDGGKVELADAIACIGETNSLSVEELVYAAAEGEPAKLDNALLRCLQEGQAPISILRATMRHFHRLHLAAARVAGGGSPDEATRLLRPPIFFKFVERFKAQLGTWKPRRIAAALDSLTRAELDSKRAVLPQETIAREALFTIARAARGR